MARHRHLKYIDIDEEYEGYDNDVYGRSTEENYSPSPSVENFMFDRSKQMNISSCITEPNIEEEEGKDKPSNFKISELPDLEKAKLMSCVEAIKRVIDVTCSESELYKKIIDSNYNNEEVINSLLNTEALKSKNDDQQMKKKFVDTASDFKFHNSLKIKNDTINSNPTDFKKGCETNNKTEKFSSLSEMISKTTKSLKDNSVSSPSFSSLADLSAHHLNISKKKTNSPSGFKIPKMNFSNSKPSNIQTSFNSLAELSAHHLKKSDSDKDDTVKNIDSRPRFVIPKITPKNIQSNKNDENNLNLIADLTAKHLNIVSESCSNTNFSSPINTINVKLEKFETYNKSCTDSSTDCLEKKEILKSFSHSTYQNLSVQIKKEKCSDDCSQNFSESVLQNISNLNIKEESNSNEMINTNMCDFRFDNVIIKKEKKDDEIKTNNHNKKENKSLELIRMIKKECSTNVSNENLKKTVSSFGKILCKKYKRKVPYQPRKKAIVVDTSTNAIIRFDFSSPSPDNIILARLGIKRVV